MLTLRRCLQNPRSFLTPSVRKRCADVSSNPEWGSEYDAQFKCSGFRVTASGLVCIRQQLGASVTDMQLIRQEPVQARREESLVLTSAFASGIYASKRYVSYLFKSCCRPEMTRAQTHTTNSLQRCNATKYNYFVYLSTILRELHVLYLVLLILRINIIHTNVYKCISSMWH